MCATVKEQTPSFVFQVFLSKTNKIILVWVKLQWFAPFKTLCKGNYSNRCVQCIAPYQEKLVHMERRLFYTFRENKTHIKHSMPLQYAS